MMTAHKHADLMLQYAKDAMETDRPWERWEVKIKNGEWCELNGNPNWVEDWGYRRKPQVIRVGRHAFPKPISNQPLHGTRYFFISGIGACFLARSDTWTGADYDANRLTGNRIHLSKDAAQAHADVLNAICRGDID